MRFPPISVQENICMGMVSRARVHPDMAGPINGSVCINSHCYPIKSS